MAWHPHGFVIVMVCGDPDMPRNSFVQNVINQCGRRETPCILAAICGLPSWLEHILSLGTIMCFRIKNKHLNCVIKIGILMNCFYTEIHEDIYTQEPWVKKGLFISLFSLKMDHFHTNFAQKQLTLVLARCEILPLDSGGYMLGSVGRP